MKTLALTVLMLSSSIVFAGPRKWEDAKVLSLQSRDTGTVAAVVPIGGGLYGASSLTQSSFYSISTERITYIMPNYSNGAMIHRWLVLTIGGNVKVSPDKKNLHILDEDGKDRSVRIISKIANQ